MNILVCVVAVAIYIIGVSVMARTIFDISGEFSESEFSENDVERIRLYLLREDTKKIIAQGRDGEEAVYVRQVEGETNAEKFKRVFGLYATELWAMPEEEFLNWLNMETR